MAVELEIRDGTPWWLSLDVWTVPHEPEGAPGQPIAGQPCYLWARVRNNGTFSVSNATVRFYWANPAVGFDRTTAQTIGTSFVNLSAGAQGDVLCLTPWVPEYVNDGHECILAEAFHPTLDPLPATPQFNVPTDRHVAQRNLSVVRAAAGFFRFFMTVFNTQRTPLKFILVATAVDPKEALPILRMLPDVDIEQELGTLAHSAFADDPCARREALEEGERAEVAMELAGNASAARTLIGQVEGGPVLIHVQQRAEGREVGGLSLLVVPEGGDKSMERSS